MSFIVRDLIYLPFLYLLYEFKANISNLPTFVRSLEDYYVLQKLLVFISFIRFEDKNY